VRRRGLAGFGEGNVAPGQPLALLEEVLVPLYFHHRYQLEAATKVVGGLEYTYAVRGDGVSGAGPGPRTPAAQRRPWRRCSATWSPSSWTCRSR
jgi:hypothetical protein